MKKIIITLFIFLLTGCSMEGIDDLLHIGETGKCGVRLRSLLKKDPSTLKPLTLNCEVTPSVLFVSDTDNARIMVFDIREPNNGEDATVVLGQSDFTSTGTGTTSTTLNGPGRVQSNLVQELLYASDEDNHRVLVFNVAAITTGEAAVNVLGQANFTSGTADRGTGVEVNTLHQPRGTETDEVNNRLFVADRLNNRVLVYSTPVADGDDADNVLGQANFTSETADRGTGVEQNTLDGPMSLAYDSTNNRLFVADSGNHRILVYDVSSIIDGENAANVLGQANFTSETGTVSVSRLDSPQGLVYNNNMLYVADTSNSRVIVYDVTAITNGENAVNVLGQADFDSSAANRGGSTAQNSLNDPTDLAIDNSNGELWVADEQNHRVLMFDIANIEDGMNADFVYGQADFTSGSANRGGTADIDTLSAPAGVALQ
jgi:hypothetical protein